MAPSVRSAAGATSGTTTTAVTVTKPAGVADGDYLYAGITNGGANTAPSGIPTDWVLVPGSSQSGTTWWGGVYRKHITSAAGEPANYTWSGATDSCTGAAVAVQAADQTTPEHAVTSRSNLSGTTGTAGLTTTVADCLILMFGLIDDNQTLSAYVCATDPATLTEAIEQLSSGGDDTGVGIASALKATAGATGASSHTLGGMRNNTGVLIAIQGPQEGGGDEVIGTGTANLGPLTATATGTRRVHGAAAAPLGNLTATATGKRVVHGTASAPLGGLTAVAAGRPVKLGQATADLGNLTATAAGKRIVHGAASAALGSLSASATGDRTVYGVAVANLGPLTTSATGQRIVHGTAVANLGNLLAHAAGTVVGVTTGIAHADLGNLTATATGRRIVHGTATADLGGLTANATGTRPPVQGSASAHLGNLTATAIGTRRVRGTLTASLGQLTATATGRRRVRGIASAPFVFAAHAAGRRTVHGVATANLGSLTATVIVDDGLPAPGHLEISTRSPSLAIAASRSTRTISIRPTATHI